MSTENLSPQIIRQVMRELQDLTTNPPEGIKVSRPSFPTLSWLKCTDLSLSLLSSFQVSSQYLLSTDTFHPSFRQLFSSLPLWIFIYRLLFLFLLLATSFLYTFSKVATNEEDITEVRASIEGPVGTPYADGLFRMKLVLGKDYPQAPPKGFFLTKIFHPNVSSTGEICVNVLKKDWKPDLGKFTFISSSPATLSYSFLLLLLLLFLSFLFFPPDSPDFFSFFYETSYMPFKIPPSTISTLS